VRVVVIGAGVIGCAVAERLARAGHRVLIVERDRAGLHASGAAAGLLAPYSEADEPGAFHRFNVRSLALFDELAARLQRDTGVDIEFRRQDTLRIAPDATALRSLEARVDWQRAQGSQARILDPVAARAVEPGLGEVAGAALFAEAQVTPPRLVTALAHSAVQSGAELREGTPVVALF
jgi:glycine oxidase